MDKYTELFKKVEEAKDKAVIFSPDEQSKLREGLEALRASGSPQGEVKTDTLSGCQAKLDLLDSYALNGRCYVRLMACMPDFRTCDKARLEHLASLLTCNLGPDARSLDILGVLTVISKGLLSHQPPALDDPNGRSFEDARGHVRELGLMMKSSARFSYEERGGVIHINGPDRTFCSCEEILCDHGWASRFILCMLATEVKVGASLDFDAIFGEGQDKASDTVLPAKPERGPQGWLDGVEDPSCGEESADEEVGAPSTSVDDFIGRLRRSAGDYGRQPPEPEPLDFGKANKKPAGADGHQGPQLGRWASPPASRVVPTILPSDSSTQIGRYAQRTNRRYMDQGSVLTVGRRGHKIEELVEARPVTVEHQVVRGFLKTKKMAREESDVNDTVYTINGLANPFRNNRLNFLCHFHTACELFSSIQGETPFGIIQKIYEMSAKTPTEELMKQVVCKTFDMERMLVVANPFKLPHIEIGMHLSDRSVAVCFDLLRGEYKTLWFGEVKSLSVPRFHDEYSDLRPDAWTGRRVRPSIRQELVDRDREKESGKTHHRRKERERASSVKPDLRRRSGSIFNLG